jgi:hypothetical protein
MLQEPIKALKKNHHPTKDDAKKTVRYIRKTEPKNPIHVQPHPGAPHTKTRRAADGLALITKK